MYIMATASAERISNANNAVNIAMPCSGARFILRFVLFIFLFLYRQIFSVIAEPRSQRKHRDRPLARLHVRRLALKIQGDFDRADGSECSVPIVREPNQPCARVHSISASVE